MRLIDADALMDDVSKRYCEECEKRRGIKKGKQTIIYEIGDAPCRACSVDDMKYELETAPTIEVRKKGKWIRLDKDNKFFVPHMLQCSECGNILDKHGVNAGRGDANYCPNCGADMRGDDHEAD